MTVQVIKNAELYFSRLDKAYENPFGAHVYETQVRTSDNNVAEEWKGMKLNVKEGEYEGKKYWYASLNRSGKLDPPKVVGPDLSPVEPSKIGNGTVANVKVWQRAWEMGTRSGISSKIDAIQVVEMKEYTPSLGFDVMAVEDVSRDFPKAPEDDIITNPHPEPLF